MIRWFDGFYGGLAAGVTSAALYLGIGVAWLRDGTVADFFAQVGHAVPALRTVPAAWPIVGVGVAMYFVLAAVLGVLYALVARGIPSMRRAPSSLAWGVLYGLLVWSAINEVAVPVLDVLAVQPLWETLLATIAGYGLVLSELTALAGRRAKAAP